MKRTSHALASQSAAFFVAVCLLIITAFQQNATASTIDTLNRGPGCTFIRADTVDDPNLQDRYVVTLRSGQDPNEFARSVGIDSVLYTYLEPEAGLTARIPLHIAEGLCAHPSVINIDRDGYVTLDEPEDFEILADEEYTVGPEPAAATSEVVTKTGAWGLDRIDQQALPLDGSFSSVLIGRNVHVYIFDTGIRLSHVEFSNIDAAQSYSAITDGRGLEDCHGHGTHVAGLVAGRTWGVASASTVHVVRVLDCRGRGTVSTVQDGVDWLLQNASPPAVVNMSFGMRRQGEASARLDASIQQLVDHGFIVIAASGNRGRDACLMTPAFLPDVITVGGLDESDERWRRSGTGPCIDGYAPATNIVSAWRNSSTGRARRSGTSMASAYVSGVIAAMLESQPHLGVNALKAAVFSSGLPNAPEAQAKPFLFLPRTP